MFLKYLIVIGFMLVVKAAYADVVVIVHKDNTSTIDKKYITRIFLGKSSTFPGGAEAIPINHVRGSEVRDAFNKDIIGRSSSQVYAYWSKLVFTGKGTPPKELKSSEEIISFVSKNINAIAYIEDSKVSDDIKIVKF